MKPNPRFVVLAAVFAGIGLSIATAAAVGGARRPNVVVILADDLGYADIGCYGNPRNRTPHLDALAAGGVRFTDFHANSSMCTPTRAALLTGRYQQRAAIETVFGMDPDEGLSPRAKTMPGYLQKAGYATGAYGKWHLGLWPPFTPRSHGFDDFVGLLSGDGDHHSQVDRSGRADWWHNDEPLRETGYTTDLVTRHALAFIDRNRAKPFFLYVAHLAVHFPWQGPHDRADRQVGGNYDGDAKFGSREDKRAAFREMVEAFDGSVGRIVGRLRELGLEKDTLVIVASDNGGYTVDRGGYVGVSSNAPWRGQKAEFYEGGHRVPAIFSWPGRIAPQRLSDATVMTMDLLPTVLELAGVPQPVGAYASDGVSLVPHLFRETPLPERMLFWRRGDTRAVRSGDWKLVANRSEPKELYNLRTDPSEQNDLSAREPERTAELWRAVSAWETDVAASARALGSEGRKRQ